MGQPRPLFQLFLVFSNKHRYNFYNKWMWKNVMSIQDSNPQPSEHEPPPIYIIKVTVCVCVLYRRPHRWTYRAQIWHGGPHLPQGGYRIHFVPEHLPPPPGGGRPKSGSGDPCSPNGAFLWKFHKTKVAGRPWFSGGGSPFWAPNPHPEGPGPPVLLEPWSLTMKESS